MRSSRPVAAPEAASPVSRRCRSDGCPRGTIRGRRTWRGPTCDGFPYLSGGRGGEAGQVVRASGAVDSLRSGVVGSSGAAMVRKQRRRKVARGDVPASLVQRPAVSQRAWRLDWRSPAQRAARCCCPFTRPASWRPRSRRRASLAARPTEPRGRGLRALVPLVRRSRPRMAAASQPAADGVEGRRLSSCACRTRCACRTPARSPIRVRRQRPQRSAAPQGGRLSGPCSWPDELASNASARRARPTSAATDREVEPCDSVYSGSVLGDSAACKKALSPSTSR